MRAVISYTTTKWSPCQCAMHGSGASSRSRSKGEPHRQRAQAELFRRLRDAEEVHATAADLAEIAQPACGKSRPKCAQIIRSEAGPQSIASSWAVEGEALVSSSGGESWASGAGRVNVWRSATMAAHTAASGQKNRRALSSPPDSLSRSAARRIARPTCAQAISSFGGGGHGAATLLLPLLLLPLLLLLLLLLAALAACSFLLPLFLPFLPPPPVTAAGAAIASEANFSVMLCFILSFRFVVCWFSHPDSGIHLGGWVGVSEMPSLNAIYLCRDQHISYFIGFPTWSAGTYALPLSSFALLLV